MPETENLQPLPGLGNYLIPIVPKKNGAGGAPQSPSWMVKIDSLFDGGAIEGYENYINLLGLYSESGCQVGDVNGAIQTASTLQHSELIIMIPNGEYVAMLETKMNTGSPLQEICIVWLGHIRKIVMLQQVVYNGCRLQTIQQQLDKVILHLKVSSRTNTMFSYNQETGISRGQTVSKVDYSKNKAE